MDTSSPAFNDAKPKMIDGKIVWSGGPSLKQYFDLPYSIMHYMATNPSTAEVYLKLIQSCKYFYEKNPILVAAYLFGKTKIYPNDYGKGFKNSYKCCIDIDMQKLSTPIWLTENLYLCEENISTFASSIYPKLYRWEKVSIEVVDEDILNDDFKSCSMFLTDVDFQNVRIIDDVGSAVMIDKVLEMVPNVSNFEFGFGDNLSMIHAATMKKICKLEHLHHLESFTLWNIPEVFNVEDVSTFLKDHPNSQILLDFVDEISEEYKIQLAAMIDTVIKVEAAKHLICYVRQNEEKHKIMCDRYYD